MMGGNGSYNKNLANYVSSVAYLVKCTSIGHTAKGSCVDKSGRYSVDNYCVELLEEIVFWLLCQVAVEGNYVSLGMKPQFGCDNKGMVLHVNNLHCPIPEKPPQADLLCIFKNGIKSLSYKV